MKRRGRSWNKTNASQESGTDAEESNSFTSEAEDDNQKNGDDSSEDSEPKDKKRRIKGKRDGSQEKKRNTPKKKVNKGKRIKESDPEDEDDQDDDDNEENVVQKTNTPKRKTSRGKRSKGSDPEDEEDQDDKDESEDDIEENENQKKNSSKKKPAKGRKSKEKAADIDSLESKNDDAEDSGLNDEEAEYEVESIIDEKNTKGIRYYLIRWKGYGEESDTWEPASTLNCPEAIQEYKKKKSGDKSKKGGSKPKKTPEPEEKWDENEDFEVVRILDVHFKRDGKREFLVAWKGYSSKYDSWEPEENMNCKEMIEKFLTKCDQAKEANPKELRVMRKATDRFTLSSICKGRRLSKRNQGKQRVQYHDAE